MKRPKVCCRAYLFDAIGAVFTEFGLQNAYQNANNNYSEFPCLPRITKKRPESQTKRPNVCCWAYLFEPIGPVFTQLGLQKAAQIRTNANTITVNSFISSIPYPQHPPIITS